MAAMRPTVSGRPTWLKMAIALGTGVALAAVLIVGNQLLNGSKSPGVVTTPVVSLAGIPEDGTVLGKPTAKVTLIEYADQQCPICRDYTLNVFPAVVREFVRTGRVKMEYRGFPFIGSDSVKAERFLLAAAKQNRLWQLQEALYRYQGRENGGWVTDDLVRELAAKIRGLGVRKLFADADSTTVRNEADGAEKKAGNEVAHYVNPPGTPTFLVQIDGQQPYYIRVALDPADFRAALDDALQG
jgi:protein-disulfide isomerase